MSDLLPITLQDIEDIDLSIKHVSGVDSILMYEFDPRVWFAPYIKLPTIPDSLCKAILARLTFLRRANDEQAVLIVLNGRLECQLPAPWIKPLVEVMIGNRFFVTVQNPHRFDGSGSPQQRLDRDHTESVQRAVESAMDEAEKGGFILVSCVPDLLAIVDRLKAVKREPNTNPYLIINGFTPEQLNLLKSN